MRAQAFPSGEGNGDTICTSPQLSPRTGKVARRAERGPWARFRAYFDLHRNDKLLLAFTLSVNCADSFPNLIRQPSAATFPRGEGNGDAICTSPQLSPRTGKVARRVERGPWARFRAYFDLHRNDKLLLAFTPSVSCADSFPPRGRHLHEPQPSPRTGKGDREAVEEVHGRTGKNNT